METHITQDDHLVFKPLNQGLKAGIVNIGSITIPGRYQTQMIEHQAEFGSHDPAMIGFPLLSDLLVATSLSYRMDQLDAIAINNDAASLIPSRLGKPPDEVTAPEVFGYARGTGPSGRTPSAVTVGARIASSSSFYPVLIRMSVVSGNPSEPPSGLVSSRPDFTQVSLIYASICLISEILCPAPL